jgi:hypothetical protein
MRISQLMATAPDQVESSTKKRFQSVGGGPAVPLVVLIAYRYEIGTIAQGGLRGCQEGHIAVNYGALARKITSSARLLNVRRYGTTYEISPIQYGVLVRVPCTYGR